MIVQESDPNYYFNRGNARLSRKENRKALNDFEEACRFAPRCTLPPCRWLHGSKVMVKKKLH